LAALPSIVAAQSKKRAEQKTTRQVAQECQITNNSPWVVKQTEWFGEPGHPWTNDTLRTQLLAAAGLSGPLLAPVQLGFEFDRQNFADTPTAPDMIKRLIALGAVRGAEWPTKSVVGAAGVHAVFLLAHRDSALGRTVLHHMMEAGPTESNAADVATLEDRLRLVWGRKQIYGTQFLHGADGRVILLPMEDSSHADLRREDAALPPLKTGICLARNQP
ncbi:MAG: DUF6624 domain-containing protein, partial [Gemmatimonadaceae bacterium]